MATLSDLKFARQLRTLRLINDIKQEQAAKLLGLGSQQIYSKLEKGLMPFSDEIIKTICLKFNITVDQFVNFEEHTSTTQNATNDTTLLTIALTCKQETIDAQKEIISGYEKQLLEKDRLIEKLRNGKG